MHLVEWLAHAFVDGLLLSAIIAFWLPMVAAVAAAVSVVAGVVGGILWLADFRQARSRHDV